jgi:hypothetical protein
MNMAGIDDTFCFPDYVCERDIYSAVGKGMDMYTLRSIGKHLDTYLRGNMHRDHCHAMTAYERHPLTRILEAKLQTPVEDPQRLVDRVG